MAISQRCNLFRTHFHFPSLFLSFSSHMSLWALVSFLAADVTPEPKKVGQSTPSPHSKKRFNYPVWKIAKSSDLKKKRRGGIRMMRQSGQIVLFVAGQSNLTVHFGKQQQQQQFCPFFRPFARATGAEKRAKLLLLLLLPKMNG